MRDVSTVRHQSPVLVVTRFGFQFGPFLPSSDILVKGGGPLSGLLHGVGAKCRQPKTRSTLPPTLWRAMFRVFWG